MKEAHYTIKDLEKLTGIKAHTLRIWEKRYGVLKPERTSTNIRHYCDDELKKLLNIALLNKHGFKISLLSKLSEDTLSDKVLSLTQSEAMEDTQIESLLGAMIDLDEARFDKILNKAVINHGFEETLSLVIQPLFEKVGMLWQANAISAAHEHFLSNLIRQKIVVAIDGVIQAPLANGKTFFLFLREGEWHEMTLLIMAYLLKKSGHKMVYFGQSLPLVCLKDAVASHQPDYLVTSVTCTMIDTETREYIGQLADSFRDRSIIVTGIQVDQADDSLPSNVSVIHNTRDFRLILDAV